MNRGKYGHQTDLQEKRRSEEGIGSDNKPRSLLLLFKNWWFDIKTARLNLATENTEKGKPHPPRAMSCVYEPLSSSVLSVPSVAKPSKRANRRLSLAPHPTPARTYTTARFVR